MALHTLLGCCWHHGHAHAVEIAHDAAETPAHDEHHCRHHHHDHDAVADGIELADGVDAADQDEGRQAPAPCSESCGDKCQFVSTSRVELERPTFSTDLHFASLPAIEITGELSFVRFETRRTTVAPLPIRLHLWNRLLLI